MSGLSVTPKLKEESVSQASNRARLLGGRGRSPSGRIDTQLV